VRWRAGFSASYSASSASGWSPAGPAVGVRSSAMVVSSVASGAVVQVLVPRWRAHKLERLAGGLELPIIAALPTARTGYSDGSGPVAHRQAGDGGAEGGQPRHAQRAHIRRAQ